MSETDSNIETENVEQQPPEEAADQAAEPAEAEDLEKLLQEAEARADENWQKLLRNQAEQENLRRRHDREVENAHKYALERFAQELLPVIDSLEMGAAAAAAEGATAEKLHEGTELTLKMLRTAIDKFGIQALHPEGEPFNPEYHQAMSMLESPEHAPNTVLNVMQKGYLLNDRLIRPAMVVVSKAGAEQGTNIDEKA